MIIFHVKDEIFELVVKKLKLHEYRDYKKYWIKRLLKLKIPCKAMIEKGYTKERIPIMIKEISVKHKKKIPEKFRDYIKTYWCFDVKYDIKEA